MNKREIYKIMAQADKFPTKVELKAEKVELGKGEDINQKYKSVLSKLTSIRNTINSGATDLSKLIDDLAEVQSEALKFVDQAKGIGLGDAKEVLIASKTAETSRSISNELIKAFQKIKDGVKTI